MPGWDIVPADVTTAAGNVERAGLDAAEAWRARIGAIAGLHPALHNHGNDRLVNAFNSGYKRRELPALRAGYDLPGRFAERAAVGKDSARLAAEAEAAAGNAMNGGT